MYCSKWFISTARKTDSVDQLCYVRCSYSLTYLALRKHAVNGGSTSRVMEIEICLAPSL